MKTFVIVPVKKFENGKTRLSSLLNIEERILLSSHMLDYTLQVLSIAPSVNRVTVVSVDDLAKEIASKHGAKFLPEEKQNGVNSAVALADRYCIEEHAEATLVVPHDLPLLDALDICRACDLAQNEDRCIVICPSLRHDGTNILLRKPPSVIRTFYDTDSYNMHVKSALKLGIPVKYLMSKNVMND
ncbi:MAG: 2-phospho-L-lactate guanylyltransferase, partial [Thermoproteota archaeon]|nr:2-phospho-L-lactate guanylyltransferase [Thermoproteota archaeon]